MTGQWKVVAIALFGASGMTSADAAGASKKKSTADAGLSACFD